MVKGMNCRMLPRLPCSRQSTHSSMNHCTNCVCGPAVREPRMEEMSRNRLAAGDGEREESHERGLGRGETGKGGTEKGKEGSAECPPRWGCQEGEM